MREKLISVTAKDCEWQYRRGSGAGGQKRSKTSSAVRCVHKPSGAVGNSEDQRSQLQNRRIAFRRMVESKEFKKWIKLECAKKSGQLAQIEEAVEKAMNPKNIREEVFVEGKWEVAELPPKS